MENLDNIYPIRNCEHEIQNDLVVVIYKKEKLTIIERLFFKKVSSKPYKIDLDDIGSFIWLLCDGEKNIAEITEIAEDKFDEKISPAKERVELFMKQMNKNKLITLYKKNDK